MKLTITIDLEAATFAKAEHDDEAHDYPLALLGEALDDIKRQLCYDGNDDFAFDRHSNRVGTWKLDPQGWQPLAASTPAHLHHETGR